MIVTKDMIYFISFIYDEFKTQKDEFKLRKKKIDIVTCEEKGYCYY